MKEMVGGCCVCSDERGWQENPLVYCDGHDCSVAVHQACYGIESVPTGPWYCERCSSGGTYNLLRCDLCPMKEGALKRTDKNGWAHVVCALYIPEIQFGNVSTMDPIILSGVPPERYNKVCYICEEKGFTDNSKVGACMQCNKNGCKACFHVTCAQQEGLLCEESGNMDNIKYCGYCISHFKKVRKGDPTIKAIPPYRPIIPASSSKSSNSTNKERNPVNNVLMIGGPFSLTNNNGNNSNSNHHQQENCVKSFPNASKFCPAMPLSVMSTDASALSRMNAISASTSAVVGSNHLKPASSAPASGLFMPQPLPASSCVLGPAGPPLPPHYPVASKPLAVVDSGSEVASTAWTKPVPHISYLGFNNDILHSSSSGHVVSVQASSNALAAASVAAVASAVGPALSSLASVAAISSVLPPRGFAVNNVAASHGGNNVGTTSQPRPHPSPAGQTAERTAAPPATAATTATATVSATKNGKSGGHKRKSESKEQTGNGEQTAEKTKKPRRTSKKTVKTLLQLVSPVVEDTISSFQREKVASQRNELVQQLQLSQQIQQQQQLLQQQHQHSSIDSVIAATAAGHQSSQCPMTGGSERAAVPAASTAVLAPEAAVVEQPSSAIPVIAPVPGPPPPKVIAFRSPQEASTSSGPPSFPTSLEQLLERQWEQGSQFLMEQAQHFDIASLLSCLNQLKMENQRLEDHVVSLAGRRDHLLAVNARLSLSLGQQHHSPNSPRISAAASMANPFVQLQPPNSQDSSHDTSENSASSRLSAPPNTSTPVALHQPFAGVVPVAAVSKAMQLPAAASSVVVSPPNRTSYGCLTQSAVPSNFSVVPGSSAGGGGVFASVKNKTSQEPSPDRLQQQTPGSFLIPRAPTPMLATDLARTPSSIVPNQYAVAQDPHHRMFYQFMQQNALAAAYGNAFTSLIQSTSPHRAAAAAVLAQSHLPPHVGPIAPPVSTQEKS